MQSLQDSFLTNIIREHESQQTQQKKKKKIIIMWIIYSSFYKWIAECPCGHERWMRSIQLRTERDLSYLRGCS